ncbi:UDP-N-acetylmuramate--L-alanine ligase [Candidatus Falkowbacteria bacterium]|nr:UDP-N-acetylmuramate--L-alanine ligase [Candidatus Falkowbacteria bacterium]
MKKYKKVHLIGVGGIHVSALAKLLMSRGVKISGSDMEESDITKELQELGARVWIGHDEDNLQAKEGEIRESRLQGGEEIDLVIYSDAVPEDNVERVKAKELSIPQMSSYDFIGELSKDYYTIAVSGTNGKSTTTAMLGLILEKAGMDPTVIVGTKVDEWGGNIRIGKSKYLVTEADEYKAHMLKLNSKMIVLTNIEEDHLDFYRDLDDIRKHFKKYVKKLSKDDILVYNKDDTNIVKLLHCSIARNISYSGKDVGSLSLGVPGEFNRFNAAAAAVASKEMGVGDDVIKKSLEKFKGTWRRFEVVGEVSGALVISDYAHHPTAVHGTIEAAREFYKGRRLVIVFQPHQHNRTKMLFDDFVDAFSGVLPDDVVIISEVYDVAGRTNDEDKKVSSKKLVSAIIDRLEAKLLGQKILYAKNLEETRGLIVRTIKPSDVVLIMGAGDIDEVARDLVKK